MKAFPAETTEAFCDGHNAAFTYFGGVPRRIVYDNTKLAVARILGDGTRQRTQVFSELQSHYLFDARFGRPGKGNDKGKVEGLVGDARRNFFVPIPRVGSWDALNADLERQCHARRGRRLRRTHTETIGERFARDREALLRRCCTNRHGPARCPPTGSSPADAIRHWSAEGGHPIQDLTAEDGLTPLPGWAPGAKAIADDGLIAEERVLHPALTMVPLTPSSNGAGRSASPT